MIVYQSADIPGVAASVRQDPAETVCREVLRRQPGGSGKYWCIQVEQRGIAGRQVVAALSRATKAAEEHIKHAGFRDRHSWCYQWYTIPNEYIEEPKTIHGAGYKSQLKVVKAVLGKQEISPDDVLHLSWECVLPQAGTPDNYQTAKRITDILRTQGLPNYVGAGRLGPGRQWAKWGKMLLAGKRLPAVAKPMKPGQLISAYQADIFNRYLAWRMHNHGLGQALPGDYITTQLTKAPSKHQDLVLADDPDAIETIDAIEAMNKRIASFEAAVLGPMLSPDLALSPAEQRFVIEEDLVPGQFTRAYASRRMLRVQPTKVLIDIKKQDLTVACQLPPDVAISTLLSEIVKPSNEVII